MGKDNIQKRKEMTQQQIDKLMNSKEFNDAAFYLGGITSCYPLSVYGGTKRKITSKRQELTDLTSSTTLSLV